MNGLVLFLNGDRGLSVLQALVNAGHEVLSAVILHGYSNEKRIRSACQTLNVRVVSTIDVNAKEFVQELAGMVPRLLIIAGYSTIFRREIIDVASLGAINLHAGPLPQYRGGSPLNWQLINGEPKAGISIVRLDEGIDTGEIMVEDEMPIGEGHTISDLHAWANGSFPALVLDVIERMDRGEITGRSQHEPAAQYWHQRRDDDGRIDWLAKSAHDVLNLVRAITHPYPGAFTYYAGTRVRVFRASLPSFKIRGTPGRICYLQGEGPYVICTDRALLLDEYSDDSGDCVTLRHGTRFDLT